MTGMVLLTIGLLEDCLGAAQQFTLPIRKIAHSETRKTKSESSQLVYEDGSVYHLCSIRDTAPGFLGVWSMCCSERSAQGPSVVSSRVYSLW